MLLTRDAAAPRGLRALLSDFGLSRDLADGETHWSTRSVGTITHVAPELLMSGHLSPRADIYALGAPGKREGRRVADGCGRGVGARGAEATPDRKARARQG